MTASQLLRQARALIEDESRWWDGNRTFANFFMDSAGRNVPRICSIQALRQAFLTEADAGALCAAGAYLMQAIGVTGVNTIPQFNDSHSHAEVMAMWDRAIDLAEAAEMYAELGPEPVEEAVMV